MKKSAAFEAGIAAALEKIAKSGLHPRAIAGFMGEGGRISKGLAGKFKMSPGEINKAGKISKKLNRKAAVKAEVTRRGTASSFFSNLPKTKVSKPPVSPTAKTAIKPLP